MEYTITYPPLHDTDRATIVGVDTHKDTHFAVAIDTLGRRLSELAAPATAAGYEQLRAWASTLGRTEAFGIEGTGYYGAGLAKSTGPIARPDTVWASPIRSTPNPPREQCWQARPPAHPSMAMTASR